MIKAINGLTRSINRSNRRSVIVCQRAWIGVGTYRIIVKRAKSPKTEA